jgi:glutamate synthase (NADPH/NADH) small chain
MDCARTAIRQGAQNVTVFNRRDQIAASQYEASYARLEGVEFMMMKTPVEILDDGVVFADNEYDADGNLRSIPGSEKIYPCTGVIVAVSQELGSNIINTTKGLEREHSGIIAVDDDGHTSRPGVFAAGDIAHGARTVVEAVATGKRVAETMHKYMMSLPIPELSVYAEAPVSAEIMNAAHVEQLL